ncbi:toxin Doc [Streptomyces goshikiensis]|uniref:toxin Doc n=1 Tax=Streptomyces goshikiensis TaxID=1942 RepID=UPI0036A3B889
MELHVDHRWLLDRQEEIPRSDLTVNDLSVLVGTAARHRVDTPRLDQARPGRLLARRGVPGGVSAYSCVLPRARNEAYGYGVAIAHLEASGSRGATWSTTAAP